MGSRQRKRTAVRKAHQAVRDSATPNLTRMEIDSERRSVGRVKPSTPPDWVVEVASNGHQYIKGDRAPAMAQTRSQKTMNASVRKARPGKAVSVRQGNGHPVREGGKPTAGREFVRGDNWREVKTAKL